MVKVNVKDLLHNFSVYKEKVKSGERVVILEHKKPIMDLTPYKDTIEKSGWKREHFVLPATEISATETCIKMRRQERY
jgi:antitoxin (DNA-binding transcriptional repressor) of toxin-antitoxin stability system